MEAADDILGLEYGSLSQPVKVERSTLVRTDNTCLMDRSYTGEFV